MLPPGGYARGDWHDQHPVPLCNVLTLTLTEFIPSLETLILTNNRINNLQVGFWVGCTRCRGMLHQPVVPGGAVLRITRAPHGCGVLLPDRGAVPAHQGSSGGLRAGVCRSAKGSWTPRQDAAGRALRPA